MSKNTNLSFLTDYITADITNGRIGINNASPAYAFDVTGIARTSTSTYLATASGSVGIGTTSPFGSASEKTIHLSDAAGGFATVYVTNSANTVKTILGMQSSNAVGLVGTQSNNPFLIVTNDTERMRITSAGRVAINVTPNGIFHAKGTSGAQVIIDFEGNNENYYDANTHIFRSVTGSYPERMRITGGGNVLIAKNNDTTPAETIVGLQVTTGARILCTVDGTYSAFSRLNSDGDLITFHRGTTTKVGSISVTTSATAYNTGSDYRLKEDLKEIKGLEKVSAIKVYDFKWKSSDDRMDGVIAHELQEVIPYAVTGEKDGEEMQGVDYSKLVPVLVKAIQELKTEIDTLKNK